MKIRYLALVLAIMPALAYAATVRSGADRSGAARVSMAAGKVVQNAVLRNAVSGTASAAPKQTQESEPEMLNAEECREEYRACMDEYCLLDESEGERCACSDNIRQSKSIIQEIQKVQADAEKLYTEGIEREKLGAKADWVFGASDKAKESASGINFYDWVMGGTSEESLTADDEIGDNLYAMAAESCADILTRCDAKVATREEQLYLREITKNCKAFDGYLADQKRAAESNLATAQAAVRSARASIMDKTNKYNRGECLSAYRSCIADKGGCGVHFENCLDAALLQRRANACENILDQCMPSREYVLQDWEAESKQVLLDAAAYTQENKLLTCRAKIRNCLEERCSASTDTMCLSSIDIAAGICPIIDDCDTDAPGIKAWWKDNLASLRLDFCQKDVTKCMQDKCGLNYDAPQCTGKEANTIAAMCPQNMFVSCKSVDSQHYGIMLSAIKLNLDYQQVENCTNYYADLLGRLCGLDMSCLPNSKTVAAYSKLAKGTEYSELQKKVENEAITESNKLLNKIKSEKTVSACTSINGNNFNSVFGATTEVVKIRARARYLAELNSQHLKLARKASVAEAKKACEDAYQVGGRPADTDEYTYISSVSFEPSLRNCHVCRKQRVCAVGGESKESGALKGAAGGLAAGASTGAMLGPWGAAIFGVVGAIGGGIMGSEATGEKKSCQEIESCEDINIGSTDDDIGTVSYSAQTYTAQPTLSDF
ncbi:MAG: hypothetical protein J5611_00900 [Alphaproteobacteria bacterium]|nr:hypothetical protein [Alphaproteobacteria bacterium]